MNEVNARRPRKADPVDPEAMRITNQFRIREGMAYELRERGTALTLHMITPLEGSSEWRCEAFLGKEAAFAMAGATRADALRATSEAWAEGGPERGLPAFDWSAVTRALTAVRAI